ncbi:transposase [Klebsiella pneumoniae]|nr:transposase [Klebsiella pneumoniae]
MGLSLRCPDYSSVSKRATSISVCFKALRGEIAHLVIDSIGLKVSGEGEWKIKKRHRTPSHLVKVALCCICKTHEIICADLSLNRSDWWRAPVTARIRSAGPLRLSFDLQIWPHQMPAAALAPGAPRRFREPSIKPECRLSRMLTVAANGKSVCVCGQPART